MRKVFCKLPDAIFCAQSLSKVRPIRKLIEAAIVALTSTVRKPGIRPKRYPLDAVSGKAGTANTSATT